MKSDKTILEALQMQPLSEEEKASRHILGRLYGPIATCVEQTRNGRSYNRELWEKALADEVFREKVAHKSLFLELGHPLDREETDMRKVCACIPEMPKLIGDELYAYVDILDTDDGKLLKLLCDYGFVPGISSRGSGELLANNEVDPETFFLDTWDIVQLPAVKCARLAMTESLHSKKSLATALRESYAEASAEERQAVQETLDALEVEVQLDDDDIPLVPSETEYEAAMSAEEYLVEDVEEAEIEEVTYDLVDEAADEEEETDTEEESIDEVTEDAAEAENAEEATTEGAPIVDTFTVGDMIKELSDYDETTGMEFNPVVIEDKEYKIDSLLMNADGDGKVTIDIIFEDTPVEDVASEATDEIVSDEANEASEDIEEISTEDAPIEDQEATEEAVDDGDDEVLESLAEMVRQKDALEAQVKSLRELKAVSDAEAGRLAEELQQYKTGFARLGEIASKTSGLKKEIKSLKEQLSVKDAKIQTLQAKATKQTQLTESTSADKAVIKSLQEKLATAVSDAESSERELTEQISSYKAKAKKNAAIATRYKDKYEAIMEHYIESKASMLGVSTRDITSRLTEGYSAADVDHVCDELLTAVRPALHIGLGSCGQVKAKINESVTRAAVEDDLTDLYILAGLK